ncbi:MAG: Gamma-glutamyl-hercynylcysteine sulfoxide hydrolase [Myxococcota bacterium]|nr:Gamma-glutamyl-hercynylcysteine sulfoxide hydrolase [Myxococcota bacterium]
MSRLIGVSCNDPVRFPRVVAMNREIFRTDPAAAHDGCGFGYYSNGEALLAVRPKGPGAVDYSQLVDDTRTAVAIMHVRRATVGAWKRENTHPFRFRRWLYAQAGTAAAVEARRAAHLESLPSFLQRNVQGETDAELVFHLLINGLNQGGLVDSLAAGRAVAENLLRSLGELGLTRSSGNVDAPSFIITNGRIMAGFTGSAELSYFLQEGIHDLDSQPERSQTEVDGDARFRAVLIADGVRAPGWQRIPPDTLLVIHENLSVQAFPVQSQTASGG